MPNSAQIGEKGRGGYVAVQMRTENLSNGGDTPQKQLVVKTATRSRTYRLVHNGSASANRHAEETVVVGEGVRAKFSTYRSGDGATAEGKRKLARFVVSALNHDGPPPQEDVVKADAITKQEIATLICLFLVGLVLPHVITYALTRYRASHSTVAQRAWMMAWLAADQFSACSTLACWILWKKRQNLIPDWLQKCFYGVLMVTGVGGFVQVVHMYLQNHDYGLQKCSV